MIIDKILYLSVKIAIIVIVFGFISLSGCVSNNEKVISEENIGGKYDAKIVTYQLITKQDYDITYEEIHYSIGDKQFRGNWLFQSFYLDSFDWIKQNTTNDSVFLNWWDYGNSIRGGTGRDVVITQPSKELWDNNLIPIANRVNEQTYDKKYGGFESTEKVKDVALALITDDITITNQIMDKYNANYIFLSMNDLTIINTMIMTGGESNYSDYYATIIISGQQQNVHNQKFYNTSLAKLLLFKGKDLKNYHLVYESNPGPYMRGGNEEQAYKAIYNMLYGGNVTVENSGYVKIFKYVNETDKL